MNASNRVTVFFYGLFMDADMLTSRGFTPARVRRAVVSDFALRLGRRATMIEHRGSVVHGMVMDMSLEDLKKLYADSTLTEYRPMTVPAAIVGGDRIEAVAYVLPRPPSEGEGNPDYAAKLRDLCRRLQFPATYIRTIA